MFIAEGKGSLMNTAIRGLFIIQLVTNPTLQKRMDPSPPPLANRLSCTGCQATAEEWGKKEERGREGERGEREEGGNIKYA